MPVAQSQGHAGKALAIAAVAIVLIARGRRVRRPGGEPGRRGDQPRRRALQRRPDRAPWPNEIDDGGGLPLLYQDLVGNDRHLFVQHLGDDPDEGWVAFGAFDPDDPSCVVLIDREEEILVNECDESVTYPLDGEGLRQYPVSVEDGEIFVDVNELTTSTTAG